MLTKSFKTAKHNIQTFLRKRLKINNSLESEYNNFYLLQVFQINFLNLGY